MWMLFNVIVMVSAYDMLILSYMYLYKVWRTERTLEELRWGNFLFEMTLDEVHCCMWCCVTDGCSSSGLLSSQLPSTDDSETWLMRTNRHQVLYKVP